MARRCCCGCPSYELFDTSDWTLVDTATLTLAASGGNDWLELEGTIEPTRAITEPYLIQFRMKGDIDLTVEGVAVSIDMLTGTASIGGNSSDIPRNADHSSPESIIQIRVTPSWISLMVFGKVNFGTSDEDPGLGCVMTVDIIDPITGGFAVTAPTDDGQFHSFILKSTKIEYEDDPCPAYSDGTVSVDCGFEPLAPAPYNAYIDSFKGDTSTYYPKRWANSGTEKYLWPNITFNGDSYSSGSSSSDNGSVSCSATRTVLDDWVGSKNHFDFINPTTDGTSGGFEWCDLTDGPSGVQGGYSTYPEELEQAVACTLSDAENVVLDGDLWDATNIEAIRGIRIEEGSYFAHNEYNWTIEYSDGTPTNSGTATPIIWFGSNIFTENGTDSDTDRSGVYYMWKSPTCSDPYPKPVGVVQYNGTEEEVKANSMAAGLTVVSNHTLLGGLIDVGWEWTF